MTWGAYDSIGGKSGQAINATSTTQNANPLTRVKAIDPTYGEGEFIYLKGCASTVVGSVVFYTAAGATTLATTRSKGPIAVAMSANVATTSLGWYQIQGRAVVKAGTVVAGASVYLTSTAGQVDDAVVTGDLVYGATFNSADGTPSAGLAELTLNYANAQDTDNA